MSHHAIIHCAKTSVHAIQHMYMYKTLYICIISNSIIRIRYIQYKKIGNFKQTLPRRINFCVGRPTIYVQHAHTYIYTFTFTHVHRAHIHPTHIHIPEQQEHETHARFGKRFSEFPFWRNNIHPPFSLNLSLSLFLFFSTLTRAFHRE